MTTDSAPPVSPAPAGATIPLPPPQPAGGRDARPPGERLGRLLTILVLALAFLVSSFPARNSDLWFHLADGRLLAHGQFAFGSDPFAYTSAGYWANHAWLFDLGLYACYHLVGGVGLVVLKAVLVTALAALLLSVRRPGDAFWLPPLCTALAVLAMSPRLLLQPACVSYFLLGLTFWLLASAPAEPQPKGSRRWLLLLLVLVVWVNVDEWFLLGPVLAALFWLGERLAGQRRTPGWVVPAGLAACLLNPYTFHAFTLPAELSPVSWSGGLRQDARFGAIFASPWQATYLRAAADLNAGALAYFALTALGLASFAAHRPALRDWRLTVWLPFAALAAWQARAVPFFAVVAAPITALNWQDFLAARPEQRQERAAGRGRALADALFSPASLLALALLALLFLAWPGWLSGYRGEGRHVAWGVQPDPSLRRATQTLQRWRDEGLLADGERVFALSPEVAHYGAWFCPGEKHFFDHRYQLFPTAARDYETVCRALEPGPGPEGDEGWQKVLHDHGVGVVVLHEPERETQRLLAGLRRLGADRKHWTLLDVSGQAVIFGRNAARPPHGFDPLAFDPGRLAFGPQDERARRELPAAPEQGPGRLPAGRDLWQRLAHPPGPLSWESPAAAVYLHYFDDSMGWQDRQDFANAYGAFRASLMGLPALPAAASLAGLQVYLSAGILSLPEGEQRFLVRGQLGPFFARLTDRSPALPLLAVRAARGALAANPEDAGAWLRLGLAYKLLRDHTCEHSAQGMLPPLAYLRNVQVVTALEQAVRLDPDLEAAHHELALLYGGQRYMDLSLEHRRAVARLARRAGRRPGETAEQTALRLEQVDRDVAKLEQTVEAARKRYASSVGALQGDRVQMAGMALQLGLARKAAEEVLLPAPPELLGFPGIKMELELLLSMGRAEDVRNILNDERMKANKGHLPYADLPPAVRPDGAPLHAVPYHWPCYEWLRVLEGAAAGDYRQAREAVQAIRSEVRDGHDRLKRELPTLERAFQQFLPGVFSGPLPFLPLGIVERLNFIGARRAALQAGEPALRAHQADLCVLEALLALEQGAPDEARPLLEEARRLCDRPPGPEVPFAGRPIAGGYLSLMTWGK